MCKILILLFILITFIKNPENAPNLVALDHYLPLISSPSKKFLKTSLFSVSEDRFPLKDV